MKTTLAALALTLGLFAACGGEADAPVTPQADSSPDATQEAEPIESSSEPAESEDAPETKSGGKVTAEVIDTAFEPNELTVKVGTEVTWEQIGDQPHSVTAVDGDFDSSPKCSPLKSENCDFEGDTYSYTFKEAGTFDYYCRIHGLPTGRGMFATVTVES